MRRTSEDRNDRLLLTAFALVGATALLVQVLLLRELMVAWRGSELSFGVSLSIWLTLTGAGSALYGIVARRIRPTRISLARGLLTLGVLAPLALVAARLGRIAMGMGAGELTGLGPLVVAGTISLAPFTLVSGFMFALAVSVLSREQKEREGAVGRVYVLEAVGAALSGLIVSFVLLPHWDPMRIAVLATVANGALACVLAFEARRRPGPSSSGSGLLAASAVIVVCAASLLGPWGTRLDDATVRAAWQDLGFRSQTNSIYGRIVTTRLGTQESIYESGVLVASSPDRLASEEATHLPLLAHPAPSRVLLLGGGLGGTALEILKHPTVTSVDYVELDPGLIHAARNELGPGMTGGLDDPRVTVHFTDARFFVKRTPGPFDVVIVNVPDPTTAQLNRFYTEEFFREVEAILAPDGIIGLAVASSETYIGEDLARLLACLSRTLSEVFPSVVTIPGDRCHFLAGRSVPVDARDADALSKKIEERGLDVVFVRDYYLRDRLSAGRTEYLDTSLAGVEAPINSDLLPACLHLSTVLENRQFADAPGLVRAAGRHLTMKNVLAAGGAMIVLLMLPALRRRRAAAALPGSVLAAVFVVGLTEISIEITALLAFQSLYGYVYHRLALIIAAFMAGLALGGHLGTEAVRRGAGRRSFTLLQAAITGVPLALGAALGSISRLPHDRLLTWSGFFPFIVVAAAVLAGAQFPLAARLCLGNDRDVGAGGGRLYGTDLFGSAIGATLAAVFLLPVLGVAGAMAALFVLNASVLVAIVLAGGLSRGSR
jgi:spermidine synthase